MLLVGFPALLHQGWFQQLTLITLHILYSKATLLWNLIPFADSCTFLQKKNEQGHRRALVLTDTANSISFPGMLLIIRLSRKYKQSELFVIFKIFYKKMKQYLVKKKVIKRWLYHLINLQKMCCWNAHPAENCFFNHSSQTAMAELSWVPSYCENLITASRLSDNILQKLIWLVIRKKSPVVRANGENVGCGNEIQTTEFSSNQRLR